MPSNRHTSKSPFPKNTPLPTPVSPTPSPQHAVPRAPIAPLIKSQIKIIQSIPQQIRLQNRAPTIFQFGPEHNMTRIVGLGHDLILLLLRVGEGGFFVVETGDIAGLATSTAIGTDGG